MIISANQPYFCPYPGFFYKAHLSDIFILLDDVQFPRGTSWLSRNRFKNDQGELWLTIPVWKKGLGLQTIKQVKICYEGRWPRKHLASLTTAYGNAPYLEEHVPFLETILSTEFTNLVDLNVAIIRYLMDCFQLDTKLVLQSELGVKARGTNLLLDLCRATEAKTFLILNPAKKYLDADLFSQAGIELRPFPYVAPIYPQLWGDFLANLSAFDLIFTCGLKARDILLQPQPQPRVLI
jgi:hypothetical protein